MKQVKTWLKVRFIEHETEVVATLNYSTQEYSISETDNEHRLLFNSNKDNFEIQKSIDRAKCVTAALKFIKQELNL